MNKLRLLLPIQVLVVAAGCNVLGLELDPKEEDNSIWLAALALLPRGSSACTLNLMGGTMQGCGGLALTGSVTSPLGAPAGSTASGDTDGTGNSARFLGPHAVTTDGTNLFVADAGNNKIRKVVIATGVVTTLAGPAQGATTTGDTDGTGTAARFFTPSAITTDGTNLYVADNDNNKIRKIVIATAVVTTLAGPAQGATTSGDTDATGNAARFSAPRGITTDGTNLYVTEWMNHKVRRVVIATGAVTTLAGPAQGSTVNGDTDATGIAARFNQPRQITTDGTNLYVADVSNNKVRQIVIATGVTSTLAGPAPGATTPGDTDGTGTAARFQSPSGIATDGTNLYVGDGMNNKLRKIVIATGAVTTLAGPDPGATTGGSSDGTGSSARFQFPVGIASDGTGLYLVDTANNKLRKIQ